MTSLLDQREFEFKLPFFSTSLSYLYLISSNALFLFYTYKILFKYSHDNQYFKKIKKWTFAMFGLIVYVFFFFLCSLFIDIPNAIYQYASIAATIYVLLIILYRPNFINKNGHKISFGQAFNRKFNDEIKAEMFEFQFFSNFYFRNKEANINDFANVLGVNKDLLFNYVYYTYSMSFDELVNKKNLGLDGFNLSGGQRQLISIARALYKTSEVSVVVINPRAKPSGIQICFLFAADSLSPTHSPKVGDVFLTSTTTS
jgi:hypothetical protein